MQHEQQDVPQQPVEMKPSKGNKKRLLLIAVLLVVVIGGGIGTAIFVMWLNSPEKLLADSLRNTLALQQTTYKADYANQAKAASGIKSLTASGKYNATQGYALTASVASVAGSDETMLDADIVFDTQGNGYYNYKNMSSTASNDVQVQEFASFQKILQASGSPLWIKQAVGGPQQSGACILAGIQKLQSDKAAEQAFTTALVQSGGLAMTTVSSTNDTTVYDLTVKTDKTDAFIKAYQGSDLYKTLAACSATGYGLTTAVVHGSDIRVTIDKKARLIKTAAVTYKNGGDTITATLTLASAAGISITVPKASQIFTSSPM